MAMSVDGDGEFALGIPGKGEYVAIPMDGKVIPKSKDGEEKVAVGSFAGVYHIAIEDVVEGHMIMANGVDGLKVEGVAIEDGVIAVPINMHGMVVEGRDALIVGSPIKMSKGCDRVEGDSP